MISAGNGSLFFVEPPARFGTTLWGRLAETRSHDPHALALFVRAYRAPVVSLALRAGQAGDEFARDAFQCLFAPPLLEAADQHQCRFRTLLLAVSWEILGGGLPTPTPEEAVRLARAAPALDPEFDLDWFRNLALEEDRARDRIEFYASSAAEFEEDWTALQEFLRRAT